MRMLVAFVGCGVVLSLMGAGLAYVFAPAKSRGFLIQLISLVGMLGVGTVVVSELGQAAKEGYLILGLFAVSPVAYLVRAHRIGRPERPRQARGRERMPVMPRHPGVDP